MAVENLARRDDKSSPAYWEAVAGHGTIWHTRVMREVLGAAELLSVALAVARACEVLEERKLVQNGARRSHNEVQMTFIMENMSFQEVLKFLECH